MSSNVLLFFATFLASAVEAVEALTIVLAGMGIVRGWRSTMVGVSAALVVLLAIVAALGPALSVIPISTLRLVVGALLLSFGLQWLRKAILRAGGYKPLHDEAAAFTSGRAEAGSVAVSTGRMDWYSFTVEFKGVLLEGLEVAFIVIGFGSTQSRLGLAVGAAAAAVVLVVAVGIVVRGPLGRVPENTLKFVVGVLLTSFGIFGAEKAPAQSGRAPTSRSRHCKRHRARFGLAHAGAAPTAAAAQARGGRSMRYVVARPLLVELRCRRRLACGRRDLLRVRLDLDSRAPRLRGLVAASACRRAPACGLSRARGTNRRLSPRARTARMFPANSPRPPADRCSSECHREECSQAGVSRPTSWKDEKR